MATAAMHLATLQTTASALSTSSSPIKGCRGGGREIGKVCRRTGLVVQPPLQLIERGTDIDVSAVDPCNKQILSGSDERLPRMKDTRHLAAADLVQNIV